MAKTKGFGIVPQYLLLGVFIATGGSNAFSLSTVAWSGIFQWHRYFSGIAVPAIAGCMLRSQEWSNTQHY